MGGSMNIYWGANLQYYLSINNFNMNRKPSKIDIIPPFPNLSNNWQLVHQIESSLNKYLSNPQLLPPQQIHDNLSKTNIEQLVITAKQLLQYIEVLRSENKFVESIKANAKLTQQKLEQHQDIIRNYQKKFGERTKAMVEENRLLKQTNEKMKRSFVETEETLRITISEAQAQATQLQSDLKQRESEKKHLLEVINNLQTEITHKNEVINRLQNITTQNKIYKTMKNKLDQLLHIRMQKKLKPLWTPAAEEYLNTAPLQQLALKDIHAMGSIIRFLTPQQTLVLGTTNKRVRLLCSSRPCVRAMCLSIIAIKNRQINYYHNHIQYFQRLREKIPSEILKTAYFRYHILKESAGHEIKQALNASSAIFEGRFEGQELYTALPDFNKEIPVKINTKEGQLLSVDNVIVDKFKEHRSQQRDQLVKEFEELYIKIKNTYDLYRADEQTISLFISNILKHFSRVFVLSKNVYFEAEQLQNLNAFLLSELNSWDRMEIDKNLKLEDLRAELQAEKKLKLFFTDKSIKSEQKALFEQNLKLTYQMKYNRLNDVMNLTCSEKDDFARKNEALTKANEKLSVESRELRKLYEITKEKYNHVIEELTVVKETIIKMNII